MVKPTMKKKALAKLAHIERNLAGGAPLDIMACWIVGQGARVGYGAGGAFLLMKPDAARAFAADCYSAEAKACGAEAIGDDLRAAADHADMATASGGPLQ